MDVPREYQSLMQPEMGCFATDGKPRCAATHLYIGKVRQALVQIYFKANPRESMPRIDDTR